MGVVVVPDQLPPTGPHELELGDGGVEGPDVERTDMWAVQGLAQRGVDDTAVT